MVAFTPSIEYDVRQVGNCMTCCCGGEGCFNTKLTGPGEIYLESCSYEKLEKLLVRKGGGGGGGGGDGGGGGGPPSNTIAR